MRKFVKIAMIFVGTVLGIFIFNLVLYANSPGYRKTLGGMVEEKNYVQGVAASDATVQSAENSVNSEESVSEATPDASSKVEDMVPDTKSDEEAVAGTRSDKEAVADARAEERTLEPEAEEKVIVDKTYHEDCGTGKGYWVITYSDGSVGLE
ncbi:MAG: hypothetical protein E7304_13950 [Butyrivibrio sp.]|jgi:hypothetical protein|uniref:hypothetical protein n=1 Tax=Butyrivibrio sp. TaxID=28121 RepID=UPI001EC48363|nr:hypothetical protein [Butyrivibrio sp.]MBE5842489.1 hypothetical protein [Butyrivibrio sp.]